MAMTGSKGRPLQTHCKRGHDLGVTREITPNGTSRCRECRILTHREWRLSHPREWNAMSRRYYWKQKLLNGEMP